LGQEVGKGCVLPLLQSLVIGALTGLIAILVMLASHYPEWWCYPIPGLMMMLLVYCALVFSQAERQPRPRREPAMYPAEARFITTLDGRQGLDLGITEDEWRRICVRLLNSKDMSFTAATVISSGFGRRKFEMLRTEMLGKGLLRWVNPHSDNSTARLTHSGYQYVCKYDFSRNVQTQTNVQMRVRER
jgi:hypothetical protein